jgi:hypothetical protein
METAMAEIMNTPAHTLHRTVLKLAGLAAIALLAIATLVGWTHFGTDILLDAASAGLSWCF